jgi:hypothetical protein
MKRREALYAIMATVPALNAQSQASTFFSAAELHVLMRVADLIIPRTDTPGAADAGVQFYIDRAASRNAKLEAVLRTGIASFQKVNDSEFGGLLTNMMNASNEFFTVMKDLTIDAYYSTREGLVSELGWHGNTYVKEFEGCTHHEHQVADDADSA